MKKVLLIVFAVIMLLSTAVYADPLEIVYWSRATGDLGATLQRMIDEFNASQDQYFVNMTYTGGYADTLAKFQTTSYGNRPDLVDMAMEYVGFFVDNPDYYVPVQKYVEEDQYDASDIMPNLVSTLTNADGGLMAIPLGNSVVGFFYNTKLLEEAGIDPITDLDSLEEIAAAADKLQANGVKYPVYYDNDSISYTGVTTSQGLPIVDQNNGKDALCTRSVIDEEPTFSSTVKYFKLIADMAKKGQLAPLGQSGNDYRTMFINDELAIFHWTISCATDIGDMSNWEMEYGFHPSTTIDAGAVNHGQGSYGCSIFLGNNGTPEKERGAWELLKWLLKPENTVAFSLASGYLPTTASGYNSETFQTFVAEKFPSAKLSYEAQMNTEPGCAAASMPMFGDFEEVIVGMIEAVINDPDYDPEQAALDLAEQTNECIEMYNLSKQ